MYWGTGVPVLLVALSFIRGGRITFLGLFIWPVLWLLLEARTASVAPRRSGVRCILFLVHAENKGLKTHDLLRIEIVINLEKWFSQ